MKDFDIQVGDRVTYEILDKPDRLRFDRGRIINEIITNDYIGLSGTYKIKEHLRNKDIEILKIERIGEKGWYTVYEKKELLTDEEREFLKNIIKYYDGISRIETTLSSISFENDNFHIICIIDYPKKLKFENIKKNEYYTLKELGLEEEV